MSKELLVEKKRRLSAFVLYGTIIWVLLYFAIVASAFIFFKGYTTSAEPVLTNRGVAITKLANLVLVIPLLLGVYTGVLFLLYKASQTLGELSGWLAVNSRKLSLQRLLIPNLYLLPIALLAIFVVSGFSLSPREVHLPFKGISSYAPVLLYIFLLLVAILYARASKRPASGEGQTENGKYGLLPAVNIFLFLFLCAVRTITYDPAVLSVFPWELIGYAFAIFFGLPFIFWVHYTFYDVGILGQGERLNVVNGWSYFWFAQLIYLGYALYNPLDSLIGEQFAIKTAQLYLSTGIESIKTYYALLLVILFARAVRILVLDSFYVLRRWLIDLFSIFLGMKITYIHLMRPDITIQYPNEVSELPNYVKGRHYLPLNEQGDHTCIVCKQCEKVCPDRIITVDGEKDPVTRKIELTNFLIDDGICCFCGLCEEVCPTNAIALGPIFDYSDYTTDSFIVDAFNEMLDASEKFKKERDIPYDPDELKALREKNHQFRKEYNLLPENYTRFTEGGFLHPKWSE